MTFEHLGADALDYFPCRYGASKLLFRGPRRDLSEPFVACLGGTETYGRFVPDPFPDRLERRLGLTCVNFGWRNAGPDVFLNAEDVQAHARNARATVLKVLGAQNMTNRFYSVHPRRNDRFVKASPLLGTIFRDVDFTEYHFTRAMLRALYAASADRFSIVAEELKQAWVARMRQLMPLLGRPLVLTWAAAVPPPDADAPPLDNAPLFVDRQMIDAVADMADDYAEVVISDDALALGTEGMIYGEMEAQAARRMINSAGHEEIADALDAALSPHLK